MLPDLDGYDVAGDPQLTGSPPVLFLTARTTLEDKAKAFGRRDDYVTKPFSLAELVMRVRAILRRSPAARQPRDGCDSPTSS